MKALCIQVQPDRVPELDIEEARKLFEELKGNSLVEKFSFEEGYDKKCYLNFSFGTNNAKSLWGVIKKKLFEHGAIGNQLAKCSIAVCSSEEGWDNYILLYHFDSSVSIESFK
jgi:hypothetical protein